MASVQTWPQCQARTLLEPYWLASWLGIRSISACAYVSLRACSLLAGRLSACRTAYPCSSSPWCQMERLRFRGQIDLPAADLCAAGRPGPHDAPELWLCALPAAVRRLRVRVGQPHPVLLPHERRGSFFQHVAALGRFPTSYNHRLSNTLLTVKHGMMCMVGTLASHRMRNFHSARLQCYSLGPLPCRWLALVSGRAGTDRCDWGFSCRRGRARRLQQHRSWRSKSCWCL